MIQSTFLSPYPVKTYLWLSLECSVCPFQAISFPLASKVIITLCLSFFSLELYCIFISKQYVETFCKWKLCTRVCMFHYLLFTFQINIIVLSFICVCMYSVPLYGSTSVYPFYCSWTFWLLFCYFTQYYHE